MSEKKPSFLDRLTTAQKIVGIIVVLVPTIYGSFKAVVNELDDLVSARDEKHRKELIEMGFLTTDAFLFVTDSMMRSMETIKEIQRQSDLYTLRGQDSIRVQLKRQQDSDRELEIQIEAIQSVLNKIQGISELSLEEQREFALTDSLQNELQLLKQEQFYREEMKQSEEQHKEQLDKIEEQENQKNKVIKVKKGRTNKQKDFGDRIMMPTWGSD